LLSHSFRILLQRPLHIRDLHSFPTRRSSDLGYTNNTTPYASGTGSPAYGDISLLGDSGTLLNWTHFNDNWTYNASDIITCQAAGDRKSTRLNSCHLGISYAVFCLKKKKKKQKKIKQKKKKKSKMMWSINLIEKH